MSDNDIAIAIDQVCKRYRIFDQPRDRLRQILRPRKCYFWDFWALRDVSFEIRRGETVGIVGQNGAGKSTLLQLICGTLAPTSGSVRVSGRVAALLELGAGFNPDFTGRENVVLYGMILGLSRADMDARMDDILTFADIGEFVDQPIKTYSTGMTVRLAFAVIAHVDADILVIDEALAVGDATFTQKCMRFLRKFQETGTILFVSHDVGAVVGLCQRAIWLDHGLLRMAGIAKEVADAYLAYCIDSQQRTASAQPAGAEVGYDPGATPAMAAPTLDIPDSRDHGIEAVEFDYSAAGFGRGDATISSVELLDGNGLDISAIEGGEHVTLRIKCLARLPMTNPIIGFFVKDRLGQFLFGDNSYVTYSGREKRVDAGDTVEALFAFDMPFLPGGDYSICVAIADGTQEEHVMQHWLHDSLIFKSLARDSVRGLVGIPMHRIEIATLARPIDREPAES